ncbi:MAG TPA: hypothetical protein VMS08_03100 [Candidatus Saccharimonadia bacterium]|nr:hypothetical protein [Candidatus Saccharimonadia bacterium]
MNEENNTPDATAPEPPAVSQMIGPRSPVEQLSDAAAPAPVTGDETPTAEVPIDHQKHRRIGLIISVFAILVLLIAAGAYYVLFIHANSSKVKPVAKATASPLSSPSPSTGPGVAERLLESSANVSGVSIGYLAGAPAKTVGSILAPNADAGSPSYSAVLFYTKPVSGVAQVFMYNVETGKETQISNETGGGVSTPVFSSTSQELSYLHYLPAAGSASSSGNSTCELVIDNVASGKLTRLTPTGQICNRPIAWSPDGSKLVYTATNNTLSAPDWDLSKLFVYDLADQTSTQLTPPSGYNDIKDFADIVWNDNTTLEVVFAQHVAVGGTYTAQQAYLVNVDTKADVVTSLIPTDDLTDMQSNGNRMYATTSTGTPQIETALGTAPANAILVPGTAGVGTFLLRYDSDSSNLLSLIFTTGQAGQQNTFKINSISPAGGTATALYSPASYSATLLGWGLDYNSLLYMTFNSGESEIHMLDLTDNTDRTLVTGLTLVQ